jgi:hypothetical protein
MKNKTLCRELAESRWNVRSRYSLSSDAPTKELREVIVQAREEEMEISQRELIQRFADNYQGIADVIDGNATFHSYGVPIFEHVKHVEDVYQEVGSGIIQKSTLLGRSRGSRMFSTSESAREAVQYLGEQQIINPSRFFNSRLIYPGANTIAKLNRSPATLPIVLGTGLAGGAVGTYLGYQIGGINGSFIGLITGFTAPIFSLGILPFSLRDGRIEAVSKERETFEKALRDLDSGVRKYFPLETER